MVRFDIKEIQGPLEELDSYLLLKAKGGMPKRDIKVALVGELDSLLSHSLKNSPSSSLLS